MICLSTATGDLDRIRVLLEDSSIRLVEIRLDYLENPASGIALVKEFRDKVVVTCRPKASGGHFSGLDKDRINLLKEAIGNGAAYVDIEHDSIGLDAILSMKRKTKVIVSYHDFDKTPPYRSLDKTYSHLKSLKPDMVKIVTYAGSINDNFEVFRLLEGKDDLVSFCMGIDGQLSRILAGKYGSRITYASDGDRISAPGQISHAELRDIYGYDRIGRKTGVVGVIGEHAEQSKSKHMHNAVFSQAGIDMVYVPFRNTGASLNMFMGNFRKFGFRGASVTMPFKETIMRYLDRIDPDAKGIGAVNTIVDVGGELVGYNTDSYGAIKALEEVTHVSRMKALVIGAGGASRAVSYALKKAGADVTVSNRTVARAHDLASSLGVKAAGFDEMEERMEKSDIIINATSVGMGKDESVVLSFPRGKIVMDIVYRPRETRFIRIARQSGCRTVTGERMLLHQAIGQSRLWTGREPDARLMERRLLENISS